MDAVSEGGVLASLDMTLSMKRGAYERKLAELQERFRAIQQAFLATGSRGVVVFEGFDAAGKGGTIRKISSVCDPRGLHVWPIAAPEANDLRRHWLARFWERVPENGQIAVFDRSWYGRVLVERVEGFAAERDWRRAYGEIEAFERQLSDDGTRIAKMFLAVSPEEQLKRLQKRVEDPLKRWKVSLEDFRNRGRWEENRRAADDMLERTSFAFAPWQAIAANSKRWARVTAMEAIADRLAEGLDLAPRKVDREIRDALEKARKHPLKP